jgi:ferredoxin
MKVAFVSKIKVLLDALSEQMDVYAPRKAGEHYVFGRYKAGDAVDEMNAIRACTPVKEFLFPVREVAATYPPSTDAAEIRPFAVFGLKECDLRSLEVLDKVFTEEGFEDPLYMSRREKMFVVASDCLEAGPTCFCGLFEGNGYATEGYDLNVAKIKDGYIVESGSKKGDTFLDRNSGVFADVPHALLDERQANREKLAGELKAAGKEYGDGVDVRGMVWESEESDVYDEEVKNCIECQACTRVCPTCHCFYLYDAKQSDYFAKMKMWDSCMRMSYAAVAGGGNPNKMLGDRMKHRLMHKFVHFLDRYGVQMCVGCGRCVDADAGGIDLREILKKLGHEKVAK